MIDITEITKDYFDKSPFTCLYSNVFGEALQEKMTISNEISRLVDLLDKETCHYFENEITFLKGLVSEIEYERISSNQPIQYAFFPNKIFNYIKREGLLGDYYIEAFIHTSLECKSYNSVQFNQYKAYTLVSIIRLFFLGDHDCAIKNICDELRLYSVKKKNKREKLVAQLSKLKCTSIFDCTTKLESLRNTLTIEIDEEDNRKRRKEIKTLKAQISFYFVAFNDATQVKKGITRSTHSRESTQRLNRCLEPLKTELYDDVIITDVIETLTLATQHPDNYIAEELASSPEKQVKIAYFLKKNNDSYAQKAIRAKAIINAQASRDMHHPCDIAQSSNFEVSTLLVEINQSINTADNPLRPIMVSLYLSLLLGAEQKQLKRMCFSTTQDGFVRVNHSHTPPTQGQRAELDDITSPVIAHYQLELPAIISRADITELKSVKVEDQTHYLQKHNKNHNTKLTVKRIASYLEFTLSKQGVDRVYRQFIKGPCLQEVAALYYTNIPLNKLFTIYGNHKKYLERIGRSPLNLAFPTPTYQNSKHIGSPLVPPNEEFIYLFSELKKRLEKVPIAQRIGDWKFHNNYTTYICLLLQISTGHRPTKNMFKTLDCFNLYTGQYWISDKENLSANASRTIYLPEIALQQVKEYLHYINASTLFNSEHQARFIQSKESLSPLLFYIEQHKIEELSPKFLISKFDTILPLQLNWNRHLLRSYFTNLNTDHELIDAWMGHAESGEPAFSKFSALTMSDMKELSRTINDFLIQLNIGAIKYDEKYCR